MTQSFELFQALSGSVSVSIFGGIPALPPHAGPVGTARVRWVFQRPLTRTAYSGSPLLGPMQILTWRSLTSDAEGSLVDVGEAEISPPFLFESQDYDVYLEWAADNGAVELSGDVAGILSKVRTISTGGGRRLTHYRLEISDDVGILYLKMSLAGKQSGARLEEVGAFELEVFPRKLGYQSDYRAMLSDIARIAPALIFEASGRASIAAGLSKASSTTAHEWYEIVKATARELLAAIDLVDRGPLRRLSPQPQQVKAFRARRVRSDDLGHALRNPKNVIVAMAGPASPRRVVERSAVPDFDNFGNRYVRWLLVSIVARLRRIEQSIAIEPAWQATESAKSLGKKWLAEIATLKVELQRRLKCEWLQDVSDYQGGTIPPTLEAHPLYSRVFALGRRFLRGLHVDAVRFTDIGVRSVSVLYEYWCFFAMVELLRSQASLVQSSAIQLSFQGSRIALRRGLQTAVTFRHRATGKLLHLFYNRSYATPTTDQRPDASIHIESENSVDIFDAKYRVQFDKSYVNAYGGVGPRVDDISTMHRYRDAIVADTGKGLTRIVKTACVLFPWTDSNAYQKHVFRKSLGVVGVGGLPFLPTATDLVAERLREVVGRAVYGGDLVTRDESLHDA